MTTPPTRLLYTALALGALLCASGCPQPIPRPQDAVEDPQELLEAVRAATLEIHSARLKNVRLDYFGQQGRVSVRQTLLQQHPDRLRVQTYIPGFDGVAGVLVCACGQFAFHDRQEDVYYYGPASAENVARVLPLGLNCRDMGHVLLGGAPHDRLQAGAPGASLSWDEQTGRYRLEMQPDSGQDAGNKVMMQIRHKDWRVAEMKTVAPGGQVLYHYTAEDFTPTQGHLLPEARRFVVADGGEDFSLRSGETQLDPELPEGLFSLAPPSGSRVQYLGPQAPPPPPQGDLCAQQGELP